MPEIVTENMERAILREAERLFLEKGFALTSTTEIAKAAGCNQALVHYYYRTKDRLFEAIFEEKLKVFLAGFLSIDETASSFEEALRRTIEAHFDTVRSNPQLPFLIFNELITNPARIASLKERLGGMFGAIYARLEATLKAEAENGRIRPIKAIDLVFDLFSLNAMFFLASPIFRNIANLSDAEYETFAEARRREHVELIIRGLRP